MSAGAWAFFDYDNDGLEDLLLVNGHVFPEVDRLDTDIRYRDRAILYRNTGEGRFEDVSLSSGPGIVEKHAARGAAFADSDNDGAVEVLVNNQNEPPTLLRPAEPPPGNWIILDLGGAIGARVALTAGGRTQHGEVRGGGSYLSQNDLRVRFGLGQAEAATAEIAWPAGETTRHEGLEANKVHRINGYGSSGRMTEPPRAIGPQRNPEAACGIQLARENSRLDRRGRAHGYRSSQGNQGSRNSRRPRAFRRACAAGRRP